ncbi:MAG: hypothetical protein RRY08_07485, partial [Christensenella sp.]
AAAVVIVAGLIAAALFLGGFFDGCAKSKRQRDLDAAMGQLPYKSEEEVQAAINSVVEDGMFNISINSTPSFENGNAEGTLGIENIPANRYLMQVNITLDDTGEMIYESGLIEPGYFIESAKLKVPLARGIYPATAIFTAIDPNDERDTVGTGSAKIVISVQN